MTITWLIVLLLALGFLAFSVILALFIGRVVHLRDTQPTPPESSDTPPGGGHR